MVDHLFSSLRHQDHLHSPTNLNTDNTDHHILGLAVDTSDMSSGVGTEEILAGDSAHGQTGDSANLAATTTDLHVDSHAAPHTPSHVAQQAATPAEDQSGANPNDNVADSVAPLSTEQRQGWLMLSLTQDSTKYVKNYARGTLEMEYHDGRQLHSCVNCGLELEPIDFVPVKKGRRQWWTVKCPIDCYQGHKKLIKMCRRRPPS